MGLFFFTGVVMCVALVLVGYDHSRHNIQFDIPVQDMI